MRKYPGLILLLLLFIIPAKVLAQNGFIVKGKIIDSTGVPIGNASITEKKQKKSAMSKEDGTFQLTVQDNAVLFFSSIGFEETEVVVKGNGYLTVMLKPVNEKLSDIVVTALGVKRDKRNLTFSSQLVKGEDITRAQEPNILNALNGKVAGVQISSTNGAPGSASSIVIRGITSMYGDNQALIVMDGVPINNDETDGGGDGGSGNNRLADIDPSVIESINVLKGAAATALYGAAGARGVLLITTKNGSKSRKPSVTLASSLSLESPIYAPRQTKYGQGTDGNYVDGETVKTSTSWGPLMDTLYINGKKAPVYDQMKEFFQTGASNNNTLSVSGGGAASDYFISYAYFDQKGTVPKAALKRHSLFTKFRSQIMDNLSATFEMTYSYADKASINEGYGLQNPLNTVYIAPISYNMRPYLNADGSQRLYRYSRDNPYWVIDNVGNASLVNRFLPQVHLNYSPFSWLTVTERLGADIYSDKFNYHVNIGDISYSTGRLYSNNLNFRQFNHDIIVQARTQMGRFSGSLMLGNNVWSRHYDNMNAYGTGLSTSGFYNMSNASSVNYSESSSLQRKVGFYAQAEIDYARLLVLSLSGRYDGSSVLSQKKAYYPYGSAALGFIFSELLQNNMKRIVNFGKLRVSYATVGNDNVHVYANNTPYYQTNTNVTFPYQGQNSALISSQLGNANLKNELQKEFELGLETKLLDSRIGLEASYYHRKMKDGLVDNVPLAYSTGYGSTIVNSAEMHTNGIEVLLTGTPVKSKNFSWDVTVNYSKQKSVVDYITGNESAGIGFVYAKVGDVYGQLYGSKYARNNAGKLLLGDDGLPFSNSNGFFGSALPRWTGGITNQFHYKQLALSFQVDTRQGGLITNTDEYYNLFYGVSKATEMRADRVVDGVNATTGDKNTVSVTAQKYFQTISYITESLVQNSSYIKLRNVSFSYTLGKSLLSRLPFRECIVTVTGRNLWIKKYAGFTGSDPESNNTFGTGVSSMGEYSFGTPTSRSYGCSLRLVF